MIFITLGDRVVLQLEPLEELLVVSPRELVLEVSAYFNWLESSDFLCNAQVINAANFDFIVEYTSKKFTRGGTTTVSKNEEDDDWQIING